MSSYGSSSYPAKGANNSRPSTGYSATSSNYAQSGRSSRSYGGRPQAVVVHKPSGPTYDPNTSTSAGNAGYYK
ncbi:hypothetical protein E8E12_008972 [Didymella heteroderae]|uniref:Uncharacterized protein n=1 Tax=Didymella heteroderae TaxID=1769908 RepID=A0A9P4WX77_9PLEO|nr:hypothetical protein E8E12_008972 [Didymella heteroderae]